MQLKRLLYLEKVSIKETILKQFLTQTDKLEHEQKSGAKNKQRQQNKIWIAKDASGIFGFAHICVYKEAEFFMRTVP